MPGLLENERYAKYYQGLALLQQRPEVRASLEVILSVFMVTTLIMVAIRPTLINIAGLQKKIEDQDTMNLKADKKIGQLFAAQAQLSEYQDRLSLFDKAVGNSISYFEMMARLEILARKHLLTTEALSAPGTKVTGGTGKIGDWSGKLIKIGADGVATANLSLTVFGSPIGIQNFMTEIEHMDKLLMIKNVVLVKESGSTKGSQRLKATIQLQYYFLIEKNET